MIAAMFLNASGQPKLLRKEDWPKFTHPEVKIYEVADLKKLRKAASSDPTELLLIDFLLGSGFRLSEMRHAEYRDIDWTAKTIRVQSKPEYGFNTKTWEARTVPLSDDLVKSLADHRKKATTELIFPGKNDHPMSKCTPERTVKDIAARAEVECAVDVKTFRSTFATMRIKEHSFQDVQHYMGHKNPQTTMRYLRVANLAGKETRTNTARTYEEIYA
jgi:integrase